MQNNFTGLISEEKIKETIPYGSENLGTCWLYQDNGNGYLEGIDNFYIS